MPPERYKTSYRSIRVQYVAIILASNKRRRERSVQTMGLCKYGFYYTIGVFIHLCMQEEKKRNALSFRAKVYKLLLLVEFPRPPIRSFAVVVIAESSYRCIYIPIIPTVFSLHALARCFSLAFLGVAKEVICYIIFVFFCTCGRLVCTFSFLFAFP